MQQHTSTMFEATTYKFYLRVEDMVEAMIGPFDTPQEAMDHYEWTKEVGDGAEFIAIARWVMEYPPRELKDCDTLCTPDEDRAFPR